MHWRKLTREKVKIAFDQIKKVAWDNFWWIHEWSSWNISKSFTNLQLNFDKNPYVGLGFEFLINDGHQNPHNGHQICFRVILMTSHVKTGFQDLSDRGEGGGGH